MAYFVEKVVVSDAFEEPTHHYRILADGSSKLVAERRPSVTIKADRRLLKKGIAGAQADAQPTLLEEALFEEEANEAINLLRLEVRDWRQAGYPGTARVTRRLLEWWFERPEERHREQKQFFFCQQEAVETVIYLHEVKGKQKMPETGDLLRYALKLATGTGKTVVMAMLITWATLHKAKVSGSPLSANFLVLVPNLTVRQRVSGHPRGDGLEPNGTEDLYTQLDIVPPELIDAFRPSVLVRNWHAIPLETSREDWIADSTLAGQRFVPFSVLRTLQRRARRDPRAGIRKLLRGWRDCIVINDEAHHAYGEKKVPGTDETGEIVWSRVIRTVDEVAPIALCVDLSATPWYGGASTKPSGMLFEWLVSDFSVYDAFESGLVKVVRLPDPASEGAGYLDLWDRVSAAKTKAEFLAGARGAIEAIYSSWKDDYLDWEAKFAEFRDPQPVLLVVADKAERAKWLFEYLTQDPAFDLLRNPDPDDVPSQVTIQVNSKVFDAEKGREAILREMVATVGKAGAAGERVRCIVSVNMLSEGWDVKSVSHIIGFRAFGSPLLTEQVVGRGLRRTDYSVLYEPLEERGQNSYETVDAFGIPFVGFPVQRSRGRRRSSKVGETPIPIEPSKKKQRYRVRVPNVRAWAVGVVKPLPEVVNVAGLPAVPIDPKITPDRFMMRPLIGDGGEEQVTLDAYRSGAPLSAIAMHFAAELHRTLNSDDGAVPGIGPTFEELLDVTRTYLNTRLNVRAGADARDVWIPVYRNKVLDILGTAIGESGAEGLSPVPLAGEPPVLDTAEMKQFRWVGPRAEGKKCHLAKIPCDSPLEAEFADFLDAANDVDRYVKNERLGFSVTYFEGGRPRQYFPDFIVAVKEAGAEDSERWMVIETKGEVWPNTDLKRLAAEKWCRMMTDAGQGDWSYLFVQQLAFKRAQKVGISTLAALRDALMREEEGEPELLALVDEVSDSERFVTHLPVYSLAAAAGYFGAGEHVELEGWLPVTGHLTEDMFVARVVGRSMGPRFFDGDYCVFRANPAGTRQGKIVLVQYRGLEDPETGGSFTVKRYRSEKALNGDGRGEWQRVGVKLVPENPTFDAITLTPKDEDDVRIVAELVSVLGRS